MKRTFVLLTLVAALVAAPAFAETTFSGSVEYHMGTDFDSYDIGTDNSTAISLDGSVGEFTTISVGLEADEDSSASATLMTLSQDVTGALGMDGAVSFAYTLGKQTFSPKVYSEVAGYEDLGSDATIGKRWIYEDFDESNFDSIFNGSTTDSMIGAVLSFGIMDKVNLDVALYPGTYTDFENTSTSTMSMGVEAATLDVDSLPEFGINAYGTFGMIDASVYFVMSAETNQVDADGDDTDTNGNYFGINLGGTYDALKFGFIYEADLEQDYVNYTYEDVDAGITADIVKDTTVLTHCLGASAQYTIDALTPGVAIKTAFYDGSEFTDETTVGVNLTYAVSEAVSAWAAYSTPFSVAEGDLVDSMGYEVGVSAALDGVTYAIGYTKDSEFKAYDAEFENSKGESLGNAFFCITASF